MAHSVVRRAAIFFVAIGGTADKRPPGRWIGTQRLTHNGQTPETLRGGLIYISFVCLGDEHGHPLHSSGSAGM
jgi:hypothetical protein